jgi:hypothetical protein
MYIITKMLTAEGKSKHGAGLHPTVVKIHSDEIS